VKDTFIYSFPFHILHPSSPHLVTPWRSLLIEQRGQCTCTLSSVDLSRGLAINRRPEARTRRRRQRRSHTLPRCWASFHGWHYVSDLPCLPHRHVAGCDAHAQAGGSTYAARDGVAKIHIRYSRGPVPIGCLCLYHGDIYSSRRAKGESYLTYNPAVHLRFARTFQPVEFDHDRMAHIYAYEKSHLNNGP